MNGFPAVPTTPWQRSVVWLLFLGPFFFASYGFANHTAANHGVTSCLRFGWESSIPFIPWTILPYWSIDLFYGLSFLCCRTPREVDHHAYRLLTAQVFSVASFLAFPLHFCTERPQVDGFFGTLFNMLMGFDQPYNQAPSLHISLLVILWSRFATRVSGPWRWLVHFWSALIGISVLTTYQHHFIDVPTGAAAGLLCLWVWPDQGELPLFGNEKPSSQRRRLAFRYLVGSTTACVLACALGGAALWLAWLSVALLFVAVAYGWTGSKGFQKFEGRHSLAVSLLLAPYIAAAWLNSRWWTRRQPAADMIADDLWLGRMPTRRHMEQEHFGALVDLSAELPAPRGAWHYHGFPWLDLTAPSTADLRRAAEGIERARQHGKVLVACALGYSRSAIAVAAWLLATGRSISVDAAETLLRSRRPAIVLSAAHRAALHALMLDMQKATS